MRAGRTVTVNTPNRMVYPMRTIAFPTTQSCLKSNRIKRLVVELIPPSCAMIGAYVGKILCQLPFLLDALGFSCQALTKASGIRSASELPFSLWGWARILATELRLIRMRRPPDSLPSPETVALASCAASDTTFSEADLLGSVQVAAPPPISRLDATQGSTGPNPMKRLPT